MNAPVKQWAFMTRAEKQEAVRPLLAKGHAYSTIAWKVGATSRGSVATIAASLRPAGDKQIAEPPPSDNRPDWTALDDEGKRGAVQPLLTNGQSYTWIAARFRNCSRVAVAGVVRRMKEAGQAVPVRNTASGRKKPPESPKAPAAPRGRKLRLIAGVEQVVIGKGPKAVSQYDFKTRAEQRASAPPITISRAAAFEPLPDLAPVPFGSAGCKWAVDGIEGKGMLWCGADRDVSERATEPYCISHVRLAYQSPRERTA